MTKLIENMLNFAVVVVIVIAGSMTHNMNFNTFGASDENQKPFDRYTGK